MERAAAEIRQPLTIMPVTAAALTEWVTRTTSGWTGFASDAMVRLPRRHGCAIALHTMERGAKLQRQMVDNTKT